MVILGRTLKILTFINTKIPKIKINPKSSLPSSYISFEIDKITKAINDHPFPSTLLPLFHQLIQPHFLENPSFIDSVIGRLFSGHANGLKALELFKFALSNKLRLPVSPSAFEITLQILTRMREFDKTLELIRETNKKCPSLITHKALCIVLSSFAKFRSFDDTLQIFEEMQRVLVGKQFGVDEFNALLWAFCTQRQMKEARAVFRRLHSQFSPNTKTLNILLLGFKECGNTTAVELFYHDMVRRGFKPSVVTYNIRIDAYCKKGCLNDALRVKEEMEMRHVSPTLETMTTLIHGAGIARNPILARRLFEEISERNLQADVGAYNALLCSFVRDGDLKSAMELMDEMEKRSVRHDNVTYKTIFLGLKKFDGPVGVCKLYRRMVDSNFVPKMQMVVMLMKFFCENGRSDLGLELWEYMVVKGCCPHGHALNILVTALCCRGKLEEAYECLKQVVERGRHPCVEGFRVLEGFLVRAGKIEKLQKLNQMMKRLQIVLPPSKGHALGLSDALM